MALEALHARLYQHFQRLGKQRRSTFGERPIFGLEHGLDALEVDGLRAEIRANIARRPPSQVHALPWIVYASEIGYGYSGDEYWQTFEEVTPGWSIRGQREWIRDRFSWFHDELGGARPSGPWATNFTIICWPITHAILPRDLQRQLAQVLYEMRHSFTADLFASPSALGQRIAARSWRGTSRFRNLAQETLLIGQIAAALLLEGELGTEGMLLPATLRRIGADLEGERSAREWLKGARHFAQERAKFRGLSSARPAIHAPPTPGDDTHAQVDALAVEPRLLLRPSDDRASWQVMLELPDLSHLPLKFPELREVLAESRCVVAGTSGRPLARGRLLHGPQTVALGRWPRLGELLLRFERAAPRLEALLRAECFLRPGPTWLFRVASDGLAYEVRSLRIRAGQRYIIVSTVAPIALSTGAWPVTLGCEGVYGALLEVPDALPPGWADSLHGVGLRAARNIQVWPAGLAATSWDGEGRGEWLASEQPCICIRADHVISSVMVTTTSRAADELELGPMLPGEHTFIELPLLPVGVHRLRVRAVGGAPEDEEQIGELNLVIREPRAWVTGVNPRGPLVAHLTPASPTLEQLWEGLVDVELRGPPGRTMVCIISLYARGADAPSFSKRLPSLELPITPAAWRAHFEKHFRASPEAENAYYAARACEVAFSADELGAFSVTCEREFTPLRWAVRRGSRGHTLTLIDDSGAAAPADVDRFAFEAPDTEERLNVASAGSIDVPALGGMYIARRGDVIAAVIVPPTVRDLAGLRCSPAVAIRARSPEETLRILHRISLWGGARLTDTVFSASRRRVVVLALAYYLFSLLGGESWSQAESSTRSGDEWLHDLKRAVYRGHQEAGLAVALALEHRDLAETPCAERVTRLSSLARRFLNLPPPATTVTRSVGLTLIRRQARDTPAHPDWLCELALRLASDPVSASSWAGAHLEAGVARLFELPTLARAARFLVLTVDRHLQRQAGAVGRLYAGWEWE